MKIARKIAEGLYVIADSYIERDYQYPAHKDRARDIANLSSDVKNVGKDMKKSITKHGERAYQSTGK